MPKVRISVTIDKTAWEDFKTFVFYRHGTLHKHLGDEVAKALDLYMASEVFSSINAETFALRLLRCIQRLNEEISELIQNFDSEEQEAEQEGAEE